MDFDGGCLNFTPEQKAERLQFVRLLRSDLGCADDESIRATIEKWAERLAQLEAENERLSGVLAQHASMFADACRDRDAAQLGFSSQIEICNDLREHNRQIESQLSTASEQLAEAKWEADRANHDYGELVVTVHSLNARLAEAEARVSPLARLLGEWVGWAKFYHVWDHVSNTAAVSCHTNILRSENRLAEVKSALEKEAGL